MEGVAQATGLQYGLTKLNQACDIALEQQRRYIEQTGQYTPLCLKDIYLALSICDSKNPKQKQYLESAKTALALILGKNNLFATRQGIPIKDLLQDNYIIPCQFLTVTQSRFLGWFILEYIRFSSINQPETTHLKHLLVFDDSSKFISKSDSIFGPGAKTGTYMHQLSVLRSTGHGVIFIDQLVEPICDDIKQLCNNWLVVGGMRGTNNHQEIMSAMSLTKEQANMLGRLQHQEAVGFYPTTFPYAVHGIIPNVPQPKSEVFIMSKNIQKIVKNIKPWHPLTEIPTPRDSVHSKDAVKSTPNSQTMDLTQNGLPPSSYLQDLSPEVKKLLWDSVSYPYSSTSVRIKRLTLSGRAFEKAKHQALEKGLLIQSSAGSTNYLIASENCYKLFDMPCPYKRNISLEHSFYVALNCFLLSKNPALKSVTSEVKYGSSSCTSDIVTVSHDGTRCAYEITLSTSNILSNATKYQNSGFAKIIFLCRNFKLKEAVKANFRESGLDPELLSKIEFDHFSNLLNRQRKLWKY